MKTKSILKVAFIIIALGIFYWYHYIPNYSRAILEKTSRRGYLPPEIVEVDYSDTMDIGDRVWYDSSLWTVISIK